MMTMSAWIWVEARATAPPEAFLSVMVTGAAAMVRKALPVTWPVTMGALPMNWLTPFTAMAKAILESPWVPFTATHQLI